MLGSHNNMGRIKKNFPYRLQEAYLSKDSIYLFISGGYNGRSYLNTIRKFNPNTKQWASITPMHYRRCFTSALAYNSNLYVLAGFDGVRRLTSVEKYCPKNKQWTVVSPLNVPRSDAAAVVHNGKMYIFGGYAGRCWITENNLLMGNIL